MNRGERRRTAPLAAGLAALLVASPGRAQPAGGEAAERIADVPSDMSQGTGDSPPPSGVDEAAELSAAARARIEAGDREGAIVLWRRAFAALPGGFGYAPRRAEVALAIAAAEEAAYRESGDPIRLHAAIQALDAYLGGLDPTDDENRAGVEDRRAEFLKIYQRASTPEGPRPAPRPEPRRGGLDRRAGLAAAGLGGAALAGGVVALAGALAGRAADGDLARATARPCTGDDPLDPCGSDRAREAAKAASIADGLRANRTALAGGILAATLLTASVAALIAGAIRGRVRVQARAAGLTVHF